MEKTFVNADQLRCIFNDEGVRFCGREEELYFPYGSIDTINLSLLGILQVTHKARIGTFTVSRGDRAEVKQMVKQAREAMKNAPEAEPEIISIGKDSAAGRLNADLSPEEQLKELKMLFVQGVISKDEYDAKKRQLRNH